MEADKLEKQAADLLTRHIGDLELEPQQSDACADFVARTPEGTLAIQVTATRRRGIEDLKGRLATAVLHAQQYAAPDQQPVVLVHAPRIGSRAVASLEEFVETYAPGLAWGAWDERGAVYLRLADLGISVDESGVSDVDEARKTTHNQRAFTDLNRWLLKVLMLRDAPEGTWKRAQPYRQEIANPAQLTRVAVVSQAKAYQFARTFRDLGLLRWDRSHFEILEPRRVFDLWYEEERQLRVERYPVRSIFSPGAGVAEIFDGVGTELGYAVGGFEACRLFGVLHTGRSVPEVHIFQNPNYVLTQLDLELCDEHEAEMYLMETPYKESVDRGVIHVGNVRVVDILQAALDAGRHARRGKEQADYIVGEVLGWN